MEKDWIRTQISEVNGEAPKQIEVFKNTIKFSDRFADKGFSVTYVGGTNFIRWVRAYIRRNLRIVQFMRPVSTDRFFL